MKNKLLYSLILLILTLLLITVLLSCDKYTKSDLSAIDEAIKCTHNFSEW